ncbi:hypothetical protein BC937DRAFT_94676 [Endogone sp. FLAS-F59071]|nr:hypothetical protein BC937DRAFT_94676 [Endogone sp. FLAS-F59071]|eukprot:RUS20664.1 hypothetical protein BC937DRAFT_94676 [Endogone sp. FLAS-F59071]
MERRPSTSSTGSSKSRNSERKGSAASTASIYDTARSPTSATSSVPPSGTSKQSKILNPGLAMSAIQENGQSSMGGSGPVSSLDLSSPPSAHAFPNSKPRKRSKDATNNPSNNPHAHHQDGSSLFSMFSGFGSSRPASPEPSPTSDGYGASGSPTSLNPLSAGRTSNGNDQPYQQQPHRKLSAGNIPTNSNNSLFPPEPNMGRRRSVDSLHHQPSESHHPTSPATSSAAATNLMTSANLNLTTTPGGGIAHVPLPQQRQKLNSEIRDRVGLKPPNLSTNFGGVSDSGLLGASPTATRPGLRRSNSAEIGHPTTEGALVVPKQKKRGLFGFARKKSHTNFPTTPLPLTTGSTTSLISSGLSPTGPSSTISLRKHSGDTVYSDTQTLNTPGWEREEPDFTATVRSAKKSGGKGSMRRIDRGDLWEGPYRDRKRNSLPKERERDYDQLSEVTLHDDDPSQFLNLNYEVNGHRRPVPYSTQTQPWSPPESWAVNLFSGSGFLSLGMPSYTSPVGNGHGPLPGNDEMVEKYEEEYSREEKLYTENYQRRTFTIRIWRADRTFATLLCQPHATTAELVQTLGRKFFITDLSKFNLYVKRYKLVEIIPPWEMFVNVRVFLNDTERPLGADEQPLQIQKQLLENMGYTDQDRLEDLGREDNSYLVSFEFAQTSVPSLTPDEEWEFGNCKNVDLQARNLTTIPIFLYRKAHAIYSLDVSKNLLIQIPNDFVQGCGQLRELRLANTELGQLPGSISLIKNLEHLDISCNSLHNLEHAKLENIKNLSSLLAFNNHLEGLPDGFALFKNMAKLHISNNSFESFPSVICDIISLVELDISFNKIPSLPENIGQLVNLTHFLAVGNQLAGALPESFAELVSLRELDVRQNAITDLEVLSKLPALDVLSVDYNSVSIVASEFKSLKVLKMCKNHLTQFSLRSSAKESASISMLVELNIMACKLSALPEDVFVNCPVLETLVLDTNFLTTIPNSIGTLQRLTRLSAQNNYLQSIPVEIAKLCELKSLDLQKNNLKTLPKEIWLCPALQTLNCSSNLLETFPNPLSAPGVALNLALRPTADAIVTPNVAANAAATGNINGPPTLGTNAGQGVVPNITPVSASPADRQSSTGSASVSNFNPPSFFASPRNHPPPLSLSLRHLFLGDNRLTDDVFTPLLLFSELRTLNLAFNDLREIPTYGLCHTHLFELYLSGNQLASLPADDIEKLSYLRVLHVNGNKLQTLPAELGKLRKLVVLDVGSNVLKYNTNNWPYDWNWNWNLSLKYLNMSGNKRLEIKAGQMDGNVPRERNLSDFSALVRLRVLGLMDVTISITVPDESDDRRIRTSPSDVNTMAYGMADWLGPQDEHMTTWDLVVPKFRSRDDESLFGLFDGRKNPNNGCKVTKFLFDSFTKFFNSELNKLKNDDTIVSALRRTFLNLEKELGSQGLDDKDSGASAVVCYISGYKLYVANVGDARVVISRSHGLLATEISQKHIPLNPSEVSRIRAAGGFVSEKGLLNGELAVSRSFGHFHLLPVVNANPFIDIIDLSEQDEFVIMASKGLWDRMSYQTAVDIARTEREDLMLAAQKLRDFAITYGAEESLMVMCIGVGDLFDRRDKKYRPGRGGSASGRANLNDSMDDPGMGIFKPAKDRNRGRGAPGDSTLARLDKEIAAPVGEVALCFTDIKNSTFLWETQGDAMRPAIKMHNDTMRRLLRDTGGYEVKTEGDSFMVTFSSITSALLWCFTVQINLLESEWPQQILNCQDGREIIAKETHKLIYRGLSVRMGIHWGKPVCEVDPITNRMDYFGPVVNRASRICNVADGGQICVSSDVIAALQNLDLEPDVSGSGNGNDPRYQLRKLGFSMMEIGEIKLKGLETPELLFVVYPKQLADRMEYDKLKAMVADTPQPTAGLTLPSVEKEKQTDRNLGNYDMTGSHILNPEMIRALGYMCLRLEQVVSICTNPQIIVGNRMSISDYMDDPLMLPVDEHADDLELLKIMEHFITRIENAANTLYLKKVGHFAKVLEQLGEAIEVDPMHIVRALQMYAQVAGRSSRRPSFVSSSAAI